MPENISSGELIKQLSLKPLFVYVNSVSLMYTVQKSSVGLSLKTLALYGVAKPAADWAKTFAASFYRDQLRHFEDPFEAGLWKPTKKPSTHWQRVPCKLFLGPTQSPRFILECLLSHTSPCSVLPRELTLSDMEKCTYMFTIKDISRY